MKLILNLWKAQVFQSESPILYVSQLDFVTNMVRGVQQVSLVSQEEMLNLKRWLEKKKWLAFCCMCLASTASVEVKLDIAAMLCRQKSTIIITLANVPYDLSCYIFTNT